MGDIQGMALPTLPSRAKLFIGILTSSVELLDGAHAALEKKYGEIDFVTTKIPFTHTDYYGSIGTGLFKIFLSFRKLIRREDIVDIKLFTNRLETRLSGKGRRRINIDPGYLTLSNVFLASCKDFFHRTYLGKGVYLENEFRYVARKLEPWDWTYPDYRKTEYLNFFYNIPRLYHNQLKNR